MITGNKRGNYGNHCGGSFGLYRGSASGRSDLDASSGGLYGKGDFLSGEKASSALFEDEGRRGNRRFFSRAFSIALYPAFVCRTSFSGWPAFLLAALCPGSALELAGSGSAGSEEGKHAGLSETEDRQPGKCKEGPFPYRRKRYGVSVGGRGDKGSCRDGSREFLRWRDRTPLLSSDRRSAFGPSL